jgi:hypothetical protein
MRRDHVAIDMDDVTNEFVTHLFACFKQEFGIELPYDGDPWGADAVAFRDGRNHEVWKLLGYQDWWGWLRARDWLWGIAPAVPGAIGAITQLRAEGWRVEALTKKPEWAQFTVWKWLRDWRPPFHSVTVVPSAESKADWSSARILVDDSLKNCAEWVKSDPRRLAILFDRSGHNLKNRLPHTIILTQSWDETLGVLREEAPCASSD